MRPTLPISLHRALMPCFKTVTSTKTLPQPLLGPGPLQEAFEELRWVVDAPLAFVALGREGEGPRRTRSGAAPKGPEKLLSLL